MDNFVRQVAILYMICAAKNHYVGQLYFEHQLETQS